MASAATNICSLLLKRSLIETSIRSVMLQFISMEIPHNSSLLFRFKQIIAGQWTWTWLQSC